MGHRIRYYAPGVRYYEVVGKCCGDEMLMRPDPAAVALTALALSVACAKHTCIHLHAFVFLSNHYHLVLGVESDEDAPTISAFLKTLNQTIAQSLNKLRERRGHFFRGKPKITAILDDAHLADRMTYTHAQPVHHGLVERAEEWLGVSSFRAVREGKAKVEVHSFDDAAWRDAGAHPDDIAEHTSIITIPVTAPSAWRALSADEAGATRRAHAQGVRDREREKITERKSGDRRSLPKPSSYARTDPFSRPTGPCKRGPQPWAHGSAEAVRRYRAAYSEMLAGYRVASTRLRARRANELFPSGTFPPGLSIVPSASSAGSR